VAVHAARPFGSETYAVSEFATFYNVRFAPKADISKGYRSVYSCVLKHIGSDECYKPTASIICAAMAWGGHTDLNGTLRGTRLTAQPIEAAIT